MQIRILKQASIAIFVLFFLGSAVEAVPLTVASASPAPGSMGIAANAPISVTFDQAVLISTVTANNFAVAGRWSGPASGSFAISNGNKTVTLTPAEPFFAGEPVMVVLSHFLQAADASPLRSAGYSYSYMVKAGAANMVFTEIAVMSNRDITNAQTRIYGAMAGDLNNDGYPDLTTVNEVSADLRVFLNRADGTGLYHPWSAPPFPIGVESSPNEPGDFNRDGNVDIAVSSADDDELWIILGNGDGTFGSAQVFAVGNEPHGVAVLDADGDGDLDVAVASRAASNIGLVLNNGSGVFGAPTFFDSGGDGEYGLNAGDMNNDQITDLIVGARDSQEVVVLGGNGNGTFTSIGTQNSGGATWVVACGDVNGDGNLDVTAANAFSHNGAALLGNGSGQMAAPIIISTPDHCVATDLGDLDGDGDLDWILSSFLGQKWQIYKNNGAAVFTFNQEFNAPQNPSCAIVLDFDRDGDLDLALTDEIADVIVLKENTGAPIEVPALSPIGIGVMAASLLAAGIIIARRRAQAQPMSARVNAGGATAGEPIRNSAASGENA